MNARLQHRATSSRVSRGRTKAKRVAASQFDHVRQTLDGYLVKALDARKRLLEAPYDPKSLHAWRVNLRRVTATLKDVARLSDDDDLRDVLSYLRTCREATGQCRDIDILAQETLPAFLETNRDKASDASTSQAVLTKKQKDVHRQAVVALKKSSLTNPLQSWRHWAESLEPPTDAQIRKTAAAAIEQRFRTIKKRAAKLDGSQKRLHRLRSATKKLRYSIELYQHAFPKRASTAWLNRLTDLQSHLGVAHDRMMGRQLLTVILNAEESAALSKPFRRWGKRTAYEASRKATQSMAKLDHLSHYWRKPSDTPTHRRERKKSRNMADDSSANRPPSTATR
jgi:CHAD domain-containing protein